MSPENRNESGVEIQNLQASTATQELASNKMRATAIRGAAWSLVQICAERATQASVFLITARLLGPTDLGMAAMAVAPALIANHALQGVTQTVIQREDAGPGYLSACFVCAIGSSLLMAMLIVAAAPILSSAVGDPLIDDLMRASALAPALTGIGLVSEGLLARKFAFSVLAIRRPLAILTGGALSIALAYFGGGAWSIIAQTILAAATGSLVCLAALPAFPRSRFSKSDWQSASSSVAKLMGRLVLDAAGQRLPEVTLGLLAGPAAAGMFRSAKALLDLVTSVLFYPISAGLLPIFARMSGDPQKLESFILNISLASLVLFCVPAFGFSIFSAQIVGIALGSAWIQVADIMMIFALALPVLALVASVPSFMIATQQAGTLLQCSAVQLLAGIALVAIGALWDVALASFGFVLSICLGAGMLWSRSLARSARVDAQLIREAIALVAMVEVSLAVLFLFRRALVSDWFSVTSFATSLALYIGIVAVFFPGLVASTLQALPPRWRVLPKWLRTC
ncbi:oligosaccharide flippase family protein [Rhizobium sullae]|uniref:oligosaccharide flippase family protein n=1 Tax=Rhizobium sullae TaxID=50338 RepID=UPI000B3570DF|nr:oligosaccharide flippase family protein [Rhizobium sullae]